MRPLRHSVPVPDRPRRRFRPHPSAPRAVAHRPRHARSPARRPSHRRSCPPPCPTRSRSFAQTRPSATPALPPSSTHPSTPVAYTYTLPHGPLTRGLLPSPTDTRTRTAPALCAETGHRRDGTLKARSGARGRREGRDDDVEEAGGLLRESTSRHRLEGLGARRGQDRINESSHQDRLCRFRAACTPRRHRSRRGGCSRRRPVHGAHRSGPVHADTGLRQGRNPVGQPQAGRQQRCAAQQLAAGHRERAYQQVPPRGPDSRWTEINHGRPACSGGQRPPRPRSPRRGTTSASVRRRQAHRRTSYA